MFFCRHRQIYFASSINEGFCWIFTLNENSEYQKARYKAKTVNDVNAMALYPFEGVPVTIKSLVTLFNSYFVFLFKRVFINSSAAFQINDAKLIPIVIPTKEQITQLESIFNEAVKQKQLYTESIINDDQLNSYFETQQKYIDEIVYKLYGI